MSACICRNGMRVTCPEHGEQLAEHLRETEARHRAMADSQRDDRKYPTDPRGQQDALGTEAPAKPCARRLNWRTADGTVAVTWCTLPEHGPGTQCSGPPPRVIELDDLGPGRRRA